MVYPRTAIDATIGKSIAADTPRVTGKVSSWSIRPALPAGLIFSAATGEISGTPAAYSFEASYTIKAKNSSGSAMAAVTIGITGARKILLELGHGSGIAGLKFLSGRVLSADGSGHWVLWNYATGRIIADGDGIPAPTNVYGQTFTPQIAAAGDTAVIPLANRLEIRDISTGDVVANIGVPSLNLGVTPSGQPAPWWQLALDGSYIVIGSSTGLSFYSVTGDRTLSITGNYAYVQAFAAPEKLLVAVGPKGGNVIETISAATGRSTLSPKFLGTFYSWFADGSHFFSSLATTYWIYSNSAVKQAVTTASSYGTLAGEGDWYWAYNSSSGVALYKIGSAAPSYTYNDPPGAVVISGTTLGILPDPYDQGKGLASVNLVDLSGSTPVVSQYNPPISVLNSFAIDSSGDWVLGNEDGVLLDGSSLSSTPRYFDYGRTWSIAGASSTIASASNRVAIATAVGKIFLFNPNPADPVYEGAIAFPAAQIAMSANGSVLGAAENVSGYDGIDGTLNFYSLPSAKILSSFDYNPYASEYLSSFTLSASGTVIGRIASPGGAIVTPLSGSPVIWSSDIPKGGYAPEIPPILLSPNGALIAQSDEFYSSIDLGSTTIWKHGVLASAIPGFGIGWIDDNRILAAENNPGGGGPSGPIYGGSAIYSAAGDLLASIPKLPLIAAFQPVSPVSIYDPAGNAIYSLNTGEAVWIGTLAGSGVGAVSGRQIVYQSGHTVVAETY